MVETAINGRCRGRIVVQLVLVEKTRVQRTHTLCAVCTVYTKATGEPARALPFEDSFENVVYKCTEAWAAEVF